MTPTTVDQIIDRVLFTLMEYESIAKPPNKSRIGKDLRLLREARPVLDAAPEQQATIDRLGAEKADLLEVLDSARRALYSKASNSTRLRAFKKIKAAIAKARP